MISDDSSTKDAIKTASDATLNVFNMHGTNLEVSTVNEFFSLSICVNISRLVKLLSQELIYYFVKHLIYDNFAGIGRR